MTIETFRRVLRQEADALAQLATQDFPHIDAILDCLDCLGAGNLFLTGHGKSGHIARKVASTFCALGRPAFYLPAGDLAHGDIGAVRAHDMVIVFSKSGEIPEFVARAGGRQVTLLFVTTDAELALVSGGLWFPAVKEACHLGLVPTSSSTMMLALGDALAVADAERRDFTRAAFAANHPGGALGRKILAENVA